MKKKKSKKAVSGDKVTLTIGGEKIAAIESNWSGGWTATGTIYPLLTDGEYYKYLDMLYEAWRELNKAGYKVKIEME